MKMKCLKIYLRTAKNTTMHAYALGLKWTKFLFLSFDIENRWVSADIQVPNAHKTILASFMPVKADSRQSRGSEETAVEIAHIIQAVSMKNYTNDHSQFLVAMLKWGRWHPFSHWNSSKNYISDTLWIFIYITDLWNHHAELIISANHHKNNGIIFLHHQYLWEINFCLWKKCK